MPTREKSAPPRAVAAKPSRKPALKAVAKVEPVKTAPAMATPVETRTKTAAFAKNPVPAAKVAAAAIPAAPKAPAAPAPAPTAVAAPMAPAKVAAPEAAAPKLAAAAVAATVAVPAVEALPKVVKVVAKTNFAPARDAFATVRQSTDALAAGFGTGGEAAAKGLQSLQSALVEALQANTDATLGYWRSIGSVKTLSEAIELQAHTARKQFEAFSTQARTIASIASRTAQEASAPVRQALDATLRRAS